LKPFAGYACAPVGSCADDGGDECHNCRASRALATLRRARVVRYLVTFDVIGIEHVHTMATEEADKLAAAPGVHVTPLIAFEEPER